MSANARVAVTGVMLVIFVGMVWMAFGYPPNSRFLPLVIGLPTSVLCLVQLVIDIRKARLAVGEDHDAERAVNIRRATVLFGWLGGFLVTILLLGFLIAMPLVMFSFLRWHQREPLRLSLSLAAGGLVGMWLIFDVLMSLPLHTGFLVDWLMS